MKLHGNARLTPRGRLLLVQRVCDRQMSLQMAALSAGVSTRTASKWVARYRQEGELGLYDRSSAPRAGLVDGHDTLCSGWSSARSIAIGADH